jgi:hypothetical protein
VKLDVKKLVSLCSTNNVRCNLDDSITSLIYYYRISQPFDVFNRDSRKERLQKDVNGTLNIYSNSVKAINVVINQFIYVVIPFTFLRNQARRKGSS